MLPLFLTEARATQLVADAAACTDEAALDSLWRSVETHYGDDLRRRQVLERIAQRTRELRAEASS